MGDGRDGGPAESGEQFHLRRELRGGLVGEQRGDGHSNEGVRGIPDHIKRWNLIREDLDREEHARNNDDPGVRQRMKARRQRDPIEARENAEGGHRRIDVQAGSKAGGDDERGDGGW